MDNHRAYLLCLAWFSVISLLPSLLLGQEDPLTLPDPPELEDLITKAEEMFARGYGDQAIPLLNKAVSKFPEYISAYHARALVFVDQREYDRAMTDYHIILSLDSLDLQAWFGLGESLTALHRFNEAEAAFSSILALPKQATERVMYRTQENGVARAFTLEGLTSDVYYMRGLTRVELDNWTGAKEDFSRAIQENDQLSDYHFQLGKVNEHLNLLPEAARNYYGCLKIASYHGGALQGLYGLQEKVPMVYTYFKDLNQDNQQSPLSLTYQGLAKFSAGELEEAIALYTKALTLAPNIPEILINRGLAKQKAKQIQGAKADFAAAIRASPDYAKPYRLLGTVYYREKSFDNALNYYNESLRLEGDDPTTLYNRALVHYNLRQPHEACADLIKAQELGQTINTDVMGKICGE